MGFFANLFGLTKWKVATRHFFVISEEAYREVAKLSEKNHPNEFFFYIIAKVEDFPLGKLVRADRVIESIEWDSGPFGSNERATKISVCRPTVNELKEKLGILKADEILILCHSHNAEGGEVNLMERTHDGRLLGGEIDWQREFVREADYPPENVLYGVFLMPEEKKIDAYRELYDHKVLSILIVMAPSERERLQLGVLPRDDYLLAEKA